MGGQPAGVHDLQKVARLAAATALLAWAAPAYPAEDSWDARLTSVEGKVTVQPAGLGADEAVPGKADMPLDAGDRVVTGSNGRAEIALDPERIIELGPGSECNVESVAHQDTLFRLAKGYLAAKLEALQKRRFRVRALNVVAAVRGTEFAVEVVEGAEPKTVVGVFGEGKMALTAEEEGEETLLNPGEEAERVGDGPIGKPRRMEFLLKRAERIKAFQARRAALREQWRRYGRENRENLRGKMLERRREMQQERDKIKDEIKRKRDEMRRGRRPRGRGDRDRR